MCVCIATYYINLPSPNFDLLLQTLHQPLELSLPLPILIPLFSSDSFSPLPLLSLIVPVLTLNLPLPPPPPLLQQRPHPLRSLKLRITRINRIFMPLIQSLEARITDIDLEILLQQSLSTIYAFILLSCSSSFLGFLTALPSLAVFFGTHYFFNVEVGGGLCAVGGSSWFVGHE